MKPAIQICFIAVAFFNYGVIPRSARAWRESLSRFIIIAVAGWVIEDSIIYFHRIYSYSDRWRFFVHLVPVTVVLVWPAIVCSAWALAKSLTRTPLRACLVGGSIVWADACVIEFIFVRNGYWSWAHATLFGVPSIGILGWSLFAFCSMVALEILDRAEVSPRRAPLAALAIPAVAYALLVAIWWGLFRRLTEPRISNFGPSVLIGISLLLLIWHASMFYHRKGTLPLPLLAARGAGATGIFLLVPHTEITLPGGLVLFLLASATPYALLAIPKIGVRAQLRIPPDSSFERSRSTEGQASGEVTSKDARHESAHT